MLFGRDPLRRAYGRRSGYGLGEEWAKLVQFSGQFTSSTVDVVMGLLCTLLSPAIPFKEVFAYALHFSDL